MRTNKLYAIVDENGKAQGDAFTMKLEAKAFVSELNRLCRDEHKSGSPLKKYKVITIDARLCDERIFNINPYSK